MILVNGSCALQAFFAITGYLVSIQFYELKEKHKFNSGFLWQAIVYRYLRFVWFVCNLLHSIEFIFSSTRLTPVYGFLIFFHATWLVRLLSGPIWRLYADVERSSCRNQFWRNLLYINNIFTTNEYVRNSIAMAIWYDIHRVISLQCIQHAWYLSADFQLMIFGTFVQMFIWRYPKSTKPIFGFSILLAWLIPAYLTYVNSFEGVFMALPE